MNKVWQTQSNKPAHSNGCHWQSLHAMSLADSYSGQHMCYIRLQQVVPLEAVIRSTVIEKLLKRRPSICSFWLYHKGGYKITHTYNNSVGGALYLEHNFHATPLQKEHNKHCTRTPEKHSIGIGVMGPQLTRVQNTIQDKRHVRRIQFCLCVLCEHHLNGPNGSIDVLEPIATKQRVGRIVELHTNTVEPGHICRNLWTVLMCPVYQGALI